jgi:hypothetical protein
MRSKRRNMAELTTEQALAFREIREAMVERLKRGYSLTGEMLRDKSMYQLLTLIQLLAGHRNYVPMFVPAWIVLEELFGEEAIMSKPAVVPKPETQPVPEKAVVN